MEKEGNENLISIDELIIRARKAGFSFGNGNPRNRLRYYAKLGLIPPAQRKSFNNGLPTGAYSESIIDYLIEIDRKLKKGKCIQAIKKESKEEKKEKKEEILIGPSSAPLSFTHIYKSPKTDEVPILPGKPREPTPISQPSRIGRLKLISKPLTIFGISFLILFFGTTIFFTGSQMVKDEHFRYFLATLGLGERFVQQPSSPLPEEEKKEEEILITSSIEPYLTINAEAAINGSLKVKNNLTTPKLILTKGEFTGTFLTSDLTADRSYAFPNLSGVVCLSTGNCSGLLGEVTTPGGTPNRLAKFITSREIGNSSISDLYTRGISITIDRTGKVGIGTTRPTTKLDVAGDVFVDGKIQATGDVCTDLRGGKCLSQVTGMPIFFGGGGGVGGSGSSGYLPVWSAGTTLDNSIVSQSGGTLQVAGTVAMSGFQLSTNATSGYILTSDDSGVGTWQPATGTLPSGSSGQTLHHDGTSWVSNSFLYNTGSAIGIGTTSTSAILTVAGDEFLEGSLYIEGTTTINTISGDLFISSSGDIELIPSNGGHLKLHRPVIESGGVLPATSTAIAGQMFYSTSTYQLYVYSAVDERWQPTTRIFTGVTPASYDGSQGGYAAANQLCANNYLGSHVCVTDEIITTIREGLTPPSNAWLIEGPPGYTAYANDCDGWTTNNNTKLGAYWSSDNKGWLTNCATQKPFACCR